MVAQGNDVWLCGAAPHALETALRSAGIALTGNADSTGLQAMVYCAPMTDSIDGKAQGVVEHASAVLEDFARHARAAAKTLAGQGGGQIVVVCDIIAQCGRAGQAARSAAGAGLIGAAKCLAKELGRHRIDVNVVCHGAQPELGATLEMSPAERKLFDMMGLGAPGTPAVLARNIAHLARGGHGMTGQVLNVDNGVVV